MRKRGGADYLENVKAVVGKTVQCMYRRAIVLKLKDAQCLLLKKEGRAAQKSTAELQKNSKNLIAQ